MEAESRAVSKVTRDQAGKESLTSIWELYHPLVPIP